MALRIAAVAAFAGLALSVSSSIAADTSAPPPNPFGPVSDVLRTISGAPPGWSRNMDGSYRQADSGVLCPVQFKSFELDDVLGPLQDDPNVLGLCRYKDGEGRIGTVRIRKPGDIANPDGAMAENDKQLLATDGSAPPMLMRASVDRKTGGARLTVTTVRKGYLVDCSVVQLDHDTPKGDFPLYCTTISAAP